MNFTGRLNARCVLAALVAGAVSFGAPAAAQEKEEGKREVRNVIIKRADKDGRPVFLEGKELSDFRSKCKDAEKAESDVRADSGDKKFRTRIVVCGDKGETSAEVRAELLKALEKARAELGEGDRISAEHRAEALAALEREIARVRAQKD